MEGRWKTVLSHSPDNDAALEQPSRFAVLINLSPHYGFVISFDYGLISLRGWFILSIRLDSTEDYRLIHGLRDSRMRFDQTGVQKSWQEFFWN